MSIQRQNVVVVDDDSGLNQAMERLLSAAGFSPRTFPSAEALLEAGIAQNAHCLVVDVRLPGLSGFELVEQLSQRRSYVPVIFITAHDDPESREQAEQAGAVAYLPKPFSGQGLLEVVNQALERDLS